MERERDKFIEVFKSGGNYLLTGVCGIGKFALALRTAKAFSNQCDILSVESCRIEDVRNIIQFVNKKPFSSPFKIVVVRIDFISNVATQALLKVLEETPKRSRFLLVGNLDLGVPDTIISRCNLFKVKPLNTYKLMELYEKKYKEKVSFAKASYAGGSLTKLEEIMKASTSLNNIMLYISLLSKGKIEMLYQVVKNWGDLEVKYFKVLIENIKTKDFSSKLLYSKDDLALAKGVILDLDKVLAWLELPLKVSLKFMYIGIRCYERK